MNINEYRLAAIRKLIDMATESKVESIRECCLKYAKEITLEDSFSFPLEWFGYLLECLLRKTIEEQTGKLIESRIITNTYSLIGVQVIQCPVGEDILSRLQSDSLEKLFIESLEDIFSYQNARKIYYFSFRLIKIPSEGVIKIKIETGENKFKSNIL